MASISKSRQQIGAALALGVASLWLAATPARADDAVDLGSKVLDPEEIRKGLFPDEECEQLKAAGFKCMGFKPPVRFSLPANSFQLGSAELPDTLKKQLDGFAEVLRARQDKDHKVRVEGHADASGDAKANLDLSRRRAEAARQYLVQKGVDGDLVKAVGVGDHELVDARNPTSAANRRVVIGRDAEAH